MTRTYSLIIYYEDVEMTRMLHRLDLGWNHEGNIKVMAHIQKCSLTYKEGEKVNRSRLSKVGKKLVKEYNKATERYQIIGVIDLWHRNLIYKAADISMISDGEISVYFDDSINSFLEG